MSNLVKRIVGLLKPSIEQAERSAEKYLKKSGVLGVAIGNKIKAGAVTNNQAIVFFVQKKYPESVLANKDKLPKTIKGYVTDVIETGGEIIPMNTARQRHRPVLGGVSGMTEGLSACTLGAIVFHKGEPCVLTNQHCVTGTDIGVDNRGKRWLQPAPLDGGKPEDKIGVVAYENRLRADKVNPIDSQIIPLTTGHKLLIHDHGDYLKKWVEPRIGLRFTKVGRTTGKTSSVITHINATASVRFGNKILRFFPCFFALQNNYDIIGGGDSGSVAFCDEGIIGQAFAASPNLAIFCYGSVIAKELDITLAPATEGYLAAGSWLTFNRTEIIIRRRANFRSSPEIADNVIELLPIGTKLNIIEGAGIKNDHFWVKATRQN